VLQTEKLRDLLLVSPPREGRPPHVTAASGLIKVGEFIYVISDDDFIIAIFAGDADTPGEVKQLLTGTLRAKLLDMGEKADLETMTDVPAFATAPDGGLLALGSGSTPNRYTGAFWPLNADGAIEGEPVPIDLTDIYCAVGSSCTELNIEGAAVVGDRLRLLQRGNGLHEQNAIVDLDLERTLKGLAEGAIPASALASITRHDIGDLDGVSLGFTDGSPLTDGRMVFSASAEDTTDPTVDGVVTGSVVGIIGADGHLENVEPLADRYKIEGVHVIPDQPGISMVLVADADDPKVPSPLLSATLP
jgi:hypothetical protein